MIGALLALSGYDWCCNIPSGLILMTMRSLVSFILQGCPQNTGRIMSGIVDQSDKKHNTILVSSKDGLIIKFVKLS